MGELKGSFCRGQDGSVHRLVQLVGLGVVLRRGQEMAGGVNGRVNICAEYKPAVLLPGAGLS